ncbi:MAG: hypothetical protein QM820_37830 [Minicystis sp.]
MPRSALAVVPVAVLAAACADAPPPVTIAPTPAAIVQASAAPTVSAARPASAGTTQPKRPPPVACPPPKGYAPVSFLLARGQRSTPRGSAVFTAPRFATADPDLAPSLAGVQAVVDAWIEGTTNIVNDCEKTCSADATCEVTRDDGEYLSLVCTNAFVFGEQPSTPMRTGFIFRREGKRFAQVTVQSFAREKDQSFLLRILPTWDVESDRPLADEEHADLFTVALRDDAFELNNATPLDPIQGVLKPFKDVAHHLACDALLDFPGGPPPTPSGETGALALAAHLDEADDPGHASRVDRTRFVAIEPRHATAAKTLNEAADGFREDLRRRAQTEGWASTDAACRAYTSTSRLVSVLCSGSGRTGSGATHPARASITIRLTDPPQRLTASDLFAAKAAAPREIAKRCLGHLVRKPKDKDDEVLKALPKLSAADLGDFALLQGGVMFAVEYDLAGKRRLMPCYVPNEVLGTSAEMLALPGKKK